MGSSLSFELAKENAPAIDASGVAAETLVNRGDTFLERLQVEYLRRAMVYVQNVQKINPQRFPVAIIHLPLGDELVAFDGDLDVRLLQIYTLHGWKAVEEVIAETWRIRKARRNGQQPDTWQYVPAFATFTRTLLALRIRSTLIDIEAVCRQRVRQNLEATLHIIDDTEEAFDIHTEERKADTPERDPTAHGGGPGGDGLARQVERVVGNRKLLTTAHGALIKAFVESGSLERLRLDLHILEAQTASAQQKLRQRIVGLSGGVIAPSELDQLPEAREQARLEREKRDKASQAPDAQQALAMLKAKLGAIATPLLLILPQMKERLDETKFARALMATLSSMRRCADELNEVVKLVPETVADTLPLEGDPITRVDRLYPGEVDMTHTLAWVALERLGSAPGNVAMLSEATLHEVLRRGEIAHGSFHHVVMTHYLNDLIQVVEEKRKVDEAIQGVSTWLARLAAVLSLASAAAATTPATAGAAPPLRAAGAVLEIPLTIYYICSTIQQLSRFDEVIRAAVVDADFTGIEAAERLGELIAMREDFILGLAKEAILMILTHGSKDWALTKRLILMRGFLSDIESLVPA